MSSIQSRLSYILLLLIISSCHSVKQTQAGDLTKEVENQILFLIFEIKHLEGKKSIKLNDKILAEGKLKDKEILKFTPTKGDLRISFLDKKGETIETFQIPDPLHQQLEYFDTNGVGAIKEVRLDKSTFDLRIQLKKEMTNVKIEEYISESVLNEIAEFEL